MSHHIQFSVNYTRSHAIDFGQNETTFTGTNFLLQPDNIGLERGNSQYDVPNRFVVNAVIESPWKHTGLVRWFADDWQIAPIYQIQSGLPYTLSVTGSAPGGVIGSINGSGGTNRIDVLGQNTFRFPTAWVADLRIAKHFKVNEKYDLEVMGDFFNLANKQNVTGINSTGYAISTSAAVPLASGGTQNCSVVACLNFNTTGPTPATGSPFAPLFNSITNVNSNFQYTPRQVQLGARFRF